MTGLAVSGLYKPWNLFLKLGKILGCQLRVILLRTIIGGGAVQYISAVSKNTEGKNARWECGVGGHPLCPPPFDTPQHIQAQLAMGFAIFFPALFQYYQYISSSPWYLLTVSLIVSPA